MRNAAFTEACWLVKNGVPFERVFGGSGRLDRLERQAMAIAFSQFEGAEFDWAAMRFKERQ